MASLVLCHCMGHYIVLLYLFRLQRLRWVKYPGQGLWLRWQSSQKAGTSQSASAVTHPTKALGDTGAGLSVSESFLSMLAADISRGAQDCIFIGDGLPTVPK